MAEPGRGAARQLPEGGTLKKTGGPRSMNLFMETGRCCIAVIIGQLVKASLLGAANSGQCLNA
jgi:hypothetical protein